MDQLQSVGHGETEHVIDIIQHPTTERSNERTLPYGCRGQSCPIVICLGYQKAINLVIILIQIIAVIVGLSLSRHEHPHAPLLFTWVVGYAFRCIAELPLVIWRVYEQSFLRSNQDPQHPSTRLSTADDLSISSLSATADAHNTTNATSKAATKSARFNGLVNCYGKGLCLFFIVWFVLGNVWIFRGHSSAAIDAPKFYRLCLALLVVLYLEIAISIILLLIAFCWVLRIPSSCGAQDATTEFVDHLPTYKFEIETDHKHEHDKETHLGANGTKNECGPCGEDVVCCICLRNYENNDEVREFPCSHFFHKNCADKWLKIKTSCPLCNMELGKGVLSFQPTAGPRPLRGQD